MATLTNNDMICRTLDLLSSSYSGSQDFATSLESLNKFSVVLARDESKRELVGRSSPQIWENLRILLEKISSSNYTALQDESQRELTLVITRFTRNLLAGNSHNQENLFQCEPAIRKLAHIYTSYCFAVDPKAYITTRFLMQALSNLITSNESLIQQLWTVYMTLIEEQNILTRMLEHSDDRTVVATLVFISNCLSGSHERMQLLIETQMGRRLCVALLNRLARYVETSDDQEDSELFEISWYIFEMLFENGFAPSLFSVAAIEGEIVNPYQTVLLKILDSYLIQTLSRNPQEQAGRRESYQEPDLVSQISTFLSSMLFELVNNAQSSIRCSLGTPPNTGPGSDDSSGYMDQNAGNAARLQSLDVLLPKNESGALSQQAQRTRFLLTDARSSQGDGVIENLIELLRLLDAFLPRIMFGKASWSTPRPGTPPTSAQADVNGRGFFYLKRDLVRLLGILCYDNRAVQDRVRSCDGITVVMNMCVTDERNPYLREHALFALRNVLQENAENQAVVDVIKPMGSWDENGILRDTPGVRK